MGQGRSALERLSHDDLEHAFPWLRGFMLINVILFEFHIDYFTESISYKIISRMLTVCPNMARTNEFDPYLLDLSKFWIVDSGVHLFSS